MEKNLIIYLNFLLPVFLMGQTSSEVFEGVSKQFSSNKPLQFDTKYSLYKSADSKIATQSYNGFFRKNDSNEIYLKIDKTEFLNTTKYSIKANHLEKAMVVSKNQKFALGNFDINQLLSYCTINSFKDYKSYWEIVLLNRPLTGLEYSKIVLLIDKSYKIKKQVFYYNTQINFSKDYRKQDFSNPRLEIVYSNYNNKPVSQALLSSETFFTISNKNKIIPSLACQNYEIDDMRFDSNNKNLSKN